MKIKYIYVALFFSFVAYGKDCDDFSGKWKGECGTGTNKFTEYYEVEQKGCEALTIHFNKQHTETLELHVGEVQTFRSTDNAGETVMTVATNWNVSKTELKISQAIFRRHNDENRSHDVVVNKIKWERSTSSLISENGAGICELKLVP